jgi:hypothetical protein
VAGVSECGSNEERILLEEDAETVERQKPGIRKHQNEKRIRKILKEILLIMKISDHVRHYVEIKEDTMGKTTYAKQGRQNMHAEFWWGNILESV